MQTLPISERVTLTMSAACAASGLGRTKIYELIKLQKIQTTTVGKRRLIITRSLLDLLKPSAESGLKNAA